MINTNSTPIQPKVQITKGLAATLAAQGWHVLPCREKPEVIDGITYAVKTPYTLHGLKDATTNPETIRKWSNRWPGALVGIACEKSGLFALDIDIDETKGVNGFYTLTDLINTAGNGKALLEMVGPAQETPRGGSHYLFKLPPDVKIPNTAGALGPGLDLRSNGYICTGDGYKWFFGHGPETPLTDAPEWLLDTIRKVTEKPAAPATMAPARKNGGDPAKSGEYWLQRALSMAVPGTRNQTGFWLGCQLRDSNIPQAEAELIARDYAASVPGDGYADFEAVSSIRSAYSMAPRQPAQKLGGNGGGEKYGVKMDYVNGDLQNATESIVVGLDLPQISPTTPTPGNQPKKNVKSPEYMAALNAMGYDFKINETSERVEVNGEPITDNLEAVIFTKLRDKGYPYVNIARDAFIAHAYFNQYHPIKDYLEGLKYDGGKYIQKLISYFDCPDDLLEKWLKRWLIGAVRRVYQPGEQNRVLVLDGPQNIGKSKFAEWLTPPELRRKHFISGPIYPDDKDCKTALYERWIWEVAELGSTTRRADREALKFFISLELVTQRPPYGRYEIQRPALANFIGTVNDENGLLSDPTGNRRFMFAKIKSIDWRGYTANLDPADIWSEARALYLAGEPADLTEDEYYLAEIINDSYEVEDPLEGIILQHFEIEPDQSTWWTPSVEILRAISYSDPDPITKEPSKAVFQGNSRAASMSLSSLMKKIGCERAERAPAPGKGRVWGYIGVKPL